MCKNVIAVSDRKACINHSFYQCIDSVVSDRTKFLILREKDLQLMDYIVFAKDVIKYMNGSPTKIILNIGNLENDEEVFTLIEETGCKNIHMPLYIQDKINNMQKFKESIDILGIPIHSLEDAVKAQETGASYITAGHIFKTNCKKGIEPRGLNFLKKICENVNIPVYGIGGINKDNAKEVIDAGAKGICIMSGYFN